MSQGFEHNASKGINLDISETNPEIYQTGKFIKNLTTAVNINADGNTTQIVGNNESIRTPLVSNELICDIQLPQGDNYAIGSYNDPQSKETFVHVWNSNKGHLIYRINENWECQKVYEGYCLNYNLASENFIPQHRNVFFYKCQTNLFTGKEEYVRYWIFTDGINSPRFISVNDSIKTHSFTQNSSGLNPKFRYSNPADTSNSILFDPCEYIELAPRMPMKCIGITELANGEPTKNNFLINKSWQFRVKFFDVWNRESEHGVISDLYIPTSNGCQGKSTSLPRCLELRIEAGSPIVAKIAIEFRNCISTNNDIPISSDWYTYDVIDKYADCGINNEKEWFDRSITLNDYDAPTNTFLYNFCAEKECTPIPVEQTNRTSNPIPILSQSITRLGNGIALSNNQVGYPKVNCDTKELLKVEYEAPIAPCVSKFCDIECWAVIHNPFVNVNEPVYVVGGTPDNNSGFTRGAWKWGGIGKITTLGTVPKIESVDSDYGQKFAGQTNNQQNFYAYLEGTEFKAQGFQQLFEGGILKDNGGVPLDDKGDFAQLARKLKNGGYYIQRFVFRNVPLGKYLIRIAGHNNTQDSNYQDSSTYVVGTIDKSNYASWNLDWTDVDTYYKELEIDTCSFTGNTFSTTTMLMICDLTCPDASFIVANSKSQAYYGYLNDSAGNPVELVPVAIDTHGITNVGFSLGPDPSLAPNSWEDLINKTDHNGFWFCAFSTVSIINETVIFEYLVESGSCPVLSTTSIGFSASANTTDGQAAEIPLTVPESGSPSVPNYALCKSILITGRVTDCNNKPVSGIVVCFTRSKSSVTNSSGYFNIIIHNDIEADLTSPQVLGRDLGAGPSDDKIFISQNGLCTFVNCASCVNCVDISYNADINDSLECFSCIGDDKTVLTVYTTRLRFPGIDQRGLKHGSTAKFGLKLYDSPGRHTFVGTNDNLELYIPKAQQQLSQQFGKVKYTLTPGFVFPSWAKYLGIYWTDQNASYKYLEFVISSVDVNINAGKITLGFQSIINYTTDNNFDTNTSWEFLKGDRIEFIADESGHFFDANNQQIGLLNFQIEGNIANNSGVIDYDSRLVNLKIGTLVQLQRPKECNNESFYYEVCAPIELISNQIPFDKLTGYLNVWNSYLVSRKIRYTLGGIETVHSFPFSFEHFAPSDTWGGNCGNRGRVNTVNPYEQQYCKPMGVVLSDSYSTNINGLSRFDESNEHQFDDHGFGSITGMITKLNSILFICSKSAFVVQYDDNTLKINSEGRVIYMGQRFSKPSPQNQELGCDASDTGTISGLNGIVMFLDRFNCALVIHNFASTADVSQGKFYGYLSSKINTIKDYNNLIVSNKAYQKIFQGIFDPEKNEYILTQFDLPLYDVLGTPIVVGATYVNQEIDVNETVPETFAFNIDPQAMCMTSFYSFTPECYGLLNNQLVSFKNAKPYNHGISNSGTTFNIFYGTKTLPVFDFVCSANSPGLVKYFQWLEIYCREQKWYAIKITTENDQLSEIPASYIEKVDNFWTTEFLCDINTFVDPTVPLLNTAAGRLIEGDSLIGKFIRIKLIRELTDQEKYFELQSAVVFATDVRKSGTSGTPR